jgi:hypothetical protein
MLTKSSRLLLCLSQWDSDDSKEAMLGRALTYLVLYSTLGMMVSLHSQVVPVNPVVLVDLVVLEGRLTDPLSLGHPSAPVVVWRPPPHDGRRRGLACVV